MTLAGYRPAMIHRLIGVLIASLLLGIGAAYADGRELSAAEKEELEKLRRDKWDEGCSDEEIHAACERRRVEILKGIAASKGPDQKALDLDFQDVLGILKDLSDQEIVPRHAADKARGRLVNEWNQAGRRPPSEQAILLRKLRSQVGRGMLWAWARSNDQEDCLKELFDFTIRKRAEGLGEEDLLDAVSTRFPKVPELLFDLFDPQDPSLEGPRPDDKDESRDRPGPKDPKDAPPRPGMDPPEDETPELSDDEVEEIVDELLLSDEGFGR